MSKGKNFVESRLFIVCWYVLLTLFAIAFVLRMADILVLDRFVYREKPGYKTESEIAYGTFRENSPENYCQLIRKETDGKSTPKFEHYRCGEGKYLHDLIWARDSTSLALAIYHDEPAWLVGNSDD